MLVKVVELIGLGLELGALWELKVTRLFAIEFRAAVFMFIFSV